jgi:lysyl-tRNA synthetase class II
MENKNNLYGRLVLSDPLRKFSRLGIFDFLNGEKYICFEKIQNSAGESKVYLIKTPENEAIVNNILSPGDVVDVKGDYFNINGETYFIGKSVNLISKCMGGSKSPIFNISKKVKESTELRSKILKRIRENMDSHGFLEITSPTLLPFYEGGDADPFKTTNKSGNDFYLKETSELILRRLISCGLGSIYEISHSFRNIGTNKNSLQEFSVVESAIPYIKLQKGIVIAEDLIKGFLRDFKVKNISLEKKWETKDFNSIYQELNNKTYSSNGDYSADRKDLSQILSSINGAPIFLVGLPLETSPINSRNSQTLNESVLVIDGSIYCDICEFEVSKEKLEERLKMQEKRNGRINKSFLKFAEYGLVPGVGISFGLERWMKCISNEDISELKNLGGVI